MLLITLLKFSRNPRHPSENKTTIHKIFPHGTSLVPACLRVFGFLALLLFGKEGQNEKVTICVFSLFFTLFLVFLINHPKVQLSYESKGYYVFATIKGKLNNGNNAEGSSMIFSPNLIRETCNDIESSDPEFSTYTECPEEALIIFGVIVVDNVYETKDVGFVRFKNQFARGDLKTTDITGLFLWTGWIFDATLNRNGDEAINEYDVPLTYDLVENGGNGNGVIESIEFENWASDQEFSGLASYYEDEWILNIADLVLTDQTISNDDSKLLKI